MTLNWAKDFQKLPFTATSSGSLKDTILCEASEDILKLIEKLAGY